MSVEQPWKPSPFSEWVIEELDKRVKNLSSGINQDFSTNNISYSSGPRRHWIRAFSSGFVSGKDTDTDWGLILKSTNNASNTDIFSQRYGISPSQQVYGFSNKDEPKFITDPQYRIHVPEPGITSFTADVQKNFYITAKLNWVCHSIDQLHAITPYFLTPLATVFVEWGWNTFNPESLLNYNVGELKSTIDNHFSHYKNRVPKSKGNYEFMAGDISNFEYSLQDNIIRGFTEIRSRQMSWSGFHIDGEKNAYAGINGEITNPALQFKTVCDQIFTELSVSSGQSSGQGSGQKQSNLTSVYSGVPGLHGTGTTTSNNILSDSPPGIVLKKIVDNLYGGVLGDLNKHKYKYVTSEEKKIGGSGNDLMDTYITFELLSYIMNSLKDQYTSLSLKNYFTVDVDTEVGYHENLISTSRNILIPNPKSPKFNGNGSMPYNDNYTDEHTKFINDNATPDLFKPSSESLAVETLKEAASNPLGNLRQSPEAVASLIPGGSVLNRASTTSDPSNTDQRKFGQDIGVYMNVTSYDVKVKLGPDFTLKQLVNYTAGKVYRNDLDKVLNHHGRETPRSNSEFSKKIPNIKNVYISLGFIKDSLVVNNDMIDMESFYNVILKELNGSVCDFWNLELCNIDGDDTSKTYGKDNTSKNPLKTSISSDSIITIPNIPPVTTEKTVVAKTRLKVVDMKGIKFQSPVGGHLFEYGSNKSIIEKINFTTTLTNAQANQILYRSFGSNSISTNNMIDFTNKGQYKDKLKSVDKTQNKEKPSELMLTFLNVMRKYMIFDEKSPNNNFLMRLKVFLTDENKYNIVDLCIPDKEALVFMLNDNDKKNNTNVYCAPIRNIEVEISLMGIAGIRVFEYFRIKNLPPPFTHDAVIFQVRDVNHTVDENTWKTKIKASLRPIL